MMSEDPVYKAKDWDMVRLANERIVATGMFFYDVANIAPSSLEFREGLDAWCLKKSNMKTALEVYGIDKGSKLCAGFALQLIGKVDITDGLCLVFPNVYQHKMSNVEWADTARPGHYKMLEFHVVDPSTRVPSTEIVPLQQKYWWIKDGVMTGPKHLMAPPHARDFRNQVFGDECLRKADLNYMIFEVEYR
ncbi:hypothetical protein GGI20_001117 [Coemansia sp. BCRC 34301]|nr:hypothetical protein GGI20_001117 [Coemansia sp. BCRC 34301]